MKINEHRDNLYNAVAGGTAPILSTIDQVCGVGGGRDADWRGITKATFTDLLGLIDTAVVITPRNIPIYGPNGPIGTYGTIMSVTNEVGVDTAILDDVKIVFTKPIGLALAVIPGSDGSDTFWAVIFYDVVESDN